MTLNIVQALAAVNLVYLALVVNTHTVVQTTVAKLAPCVLGVTLLFFSVASYMGWPV